MENKKKILWISHSQHLGGAELCLVEAVAELSKFGFDILVLIPSKGNLQKRLDELQIKNKTVAYPWWVQEGGNKFGVKIRKTISHIRSVFRLIPIFTAFKPEFVFTNTLTVPTGAVTARLLNKPHFWFIHEYGQEDQKLAFDYGNKFSYWSIGFFSRKVVANSEAIYNKLQKYILRKKVVIARYGVDIPVSATSHFSSGLKNIVLAGRITPEKGHRDAVEALNILIKKRIDVRLIFIGSVTSNAFKLELQHKIDGLGLSEYVQFIEYTPTPFDIYVNADLFLMCSINEAFGRITIEAMKLGKPVIGANAGGTKELIKNGFNGFLYAPGCFEELAMYIEKLYKDQALYREMADNAYNWSNENFSKELYAKTIIDIIN